MYEDFPMTLNTKCEMIIQVLMQILERKSPWGSHRNNLVLPPWCPPLSEMVGILSMSWNWCCFVISWGQLKLITYLLWAALLWFSFALEVYIMWCLRWQFQPKLLPITLILPRAFLDTTVTTSERLTSWWWVTTSGTWVYTSSAWPSLTTDFTPLWSRRLVEQPSLAFLVQAGDNACIGYAWAHLPQWEVNICSWKQEGPANLLVNSSLDP